VELASFLQPVQTSVPDVPQKTHKKPQIIPVDVVITTNPLFSYPKFNYPSLLNHNV